MSLKALLLVTAIAAVAWMGHETALAQFGPPSTVFGTIVDADGEIPAGLPVVAYIGDLVCSTSEELTAHTGDGDAEVAVYAIDVVSEQQIEGCGNADADVRIQIDGRFADDTVRWRAGPVELNITFGNAPTVPVPTFTPTATATSTPTPLPATATATPNESSATPSTDGTATPDGTSSGTATAEATPSPTLAGGVTTNGSTPNGGDGDDDGGGGIPIWVYGLIIVAAIAIVGGGLGYFLSRSPAEDVPLPPEDEL